MQPVEEEGEKDPFENVVFFGRKGAGGGLPYSPPPEPAPTLQEHVASGAKDESAIRLLEQMLEDFKAGKFHGVVIVAGVVDPETGYVRDHSTAISEIVAAIPYSFVGCLEDAKLTILESTQDFDDELDDLDEYED